MDSRPNLDRNAHLYLDASPDSHSAANSYTTTAEPHAVAQSDAMAYLDTVAHVASRDQDPGRYAHALAYLAHVDAAANSDTVADAHTHAHTCADRDVNPYHNLHTYGDAYRHANGY